MARLRLPGVTLCAATSVNVAATILALKQCLNLVEFADCLLLTDAAVGEPDPRISVTPIAPIASSADYSDFLLVKLIDYVSSPHCLIVQWDGFVLDADRWAPDFLDYDYIGAPWPQFSHGHDVGNGGFSLRSRRLLEACRDSRFHKSHPEDVAICRVNRELLEREHQIRFADRLTASRFAFERGPPDEPTFGFHGVFNMIPVLGPDRFWEVYRTLDDRRTAFVDYRRIMGQLGGGRSRMKRRIQLTRDLVAAGFAR